MRNCDAGSSCLPYFRGCRVCTSEFVRGQSGRRQRRSAVDYRSKRSDRARFGEAELRGWRLLLRGMSCCMHVCVNVGPLPAVRRDVVDDDVVRSGRVAHGIAARRRSEYAKPNFSYITLIPRSQPRSQMSVSVEYPERDREDSGVPAPAERLRPFQKPSTPRNHKPAF